MEAYAEALGRCSAEAAFWLRHPREREVVPELGDRTPSDRDAGGDDPRYPEPELDIVTIETRLNGVDS
jgi:hypothetical protein